MLSTSASSKPFCPESAQMCRYRIPTNRFWLWLYSRPAVMLYIASVSSTFPLTANVVVPSSMLSIVSSQSRNPIPPPKRGVSEPPANAVLPKGVKRAVAWPLKVFTSPLTLSSPPTDAKFVPPTVTVRVPFALSWSNSRRCYRNRFYICNVRPSTRSWVS